MRTSTALRQLPTTVVALLAALALAVAAALLTGAGLTSSDKAGATWNKKSDFAGATWNSHRLAGATWNVVRPARSFGATWN
jgi:hypothetical protein